MNRLKFLQILVALMALSCSGDLPRSIVVVYENDVHCNMDGYAKFAGIRDAIADTADVITVSSGDFLQGGAMGSVSRGGYVVSMMNAVGYDVVTLGNHEFDYKLPRLMELSDSLESFVVCANLVEKNTVTPLFQPYVLKRIGSKNIAFVGALTPQVLVAESYAFANDSLGVAYDVPSDKIVKLIQTAIDDARRAGADYVILLSHLGLVPPVTSLEVIQKTTGIDAVLDGHSHSIVPEQFVRNANGDSVLLSQTGTKFQSVGVMDISPNGRFHSRLIPMDSVTTENRKVAAVYDSLNSICASQLQKQISSTEFDLTIVGDDGKRLVRSGETNLGDLVADAMRYAVGAQIGLVNGGSVRKTIPAGAITYRDVLDVMPFANDMCLIRATGRQIMDALAMGVAHLPEEFGGFMQVSGLRYTVVVDSVARIEHVQVETDSGFVDIAEDDVFTVGLSSYNAYEGKEITAFRQSEIIADKVMKDSEAFVKFLKNLGSEIPDAYRIPKGRILVKTNR